MKEERPQIEQCPICRGVKKYREKKDAKGNVIKICKPCDGKGYIIK